MSESARPHHVLTLDPEDDYGACVEASERVAWKLDDIFPVGTRLDFNRCFLPESLALTSSHAFLSENERRALNQISGHAYLNLFGFVEEYILGKILRRTHACWQEGELTDGIRDHVAIRALSRFADEELKHQQLFARYKDAFARDFGATCEVLDRAPQVASVMLKKSALAGMLMVLHIELMTQVHYTESVRGDAHLDPLFARLLKQHWLEEIQHARIDVLELAKLASRATPEQIRIAFIEYLDLIDAFSGLLRGQAEMDARTLARRIGRNLTEAETADVAALRHQAYRRMFLWMGLTHPTFMKLAQQLDGEVAAQLIERAQGLLV